jgi:glycosyltransferase involved in cell wall biosynthesis
VISVSDHLPNVAWPFLAARVFQPDTLFVADWADLFAEGGLHEHWNRGPGKPFYLVSQLLERGIKRRAHLCTATSRPLLKALQDRLDISTLRTFHLPSGCDTQMVFPASQRQARLETGMPLDSLIVGRTSSTGNMTNAEIDAMIQLSERYRALTKKDLVHYLIGPCDRNRYSRLFQSNCQVRVTGRLAPSETPRHLAACDLFLTIEDDTPNNRCRGPIRLNDYLAAGRPIVCNSIGDHVETLAMHEAAVICDDLRTPHPGLDSILTGPAIRQAMGQRARALAEGDLSWEKLAQNFEWFLLQNAPVLQGAEAAVPSYVSEHSATIAGNLSR